jgi:hypothetical protein
MSNETIGDVFRQEIIEGLYNRKHIDQKIRKEILANPDMLAKVEAGTAALEAWLAQTNHWESKRKRLTQLSQMNLEELVLDLFTGVAYVLRPALFTSITAQMAARLQFSDRVAAISTVGEVLAVLASTDAFDITKADRNASLKLVSRIPLSERLLGFIERSECLPPMVCAPLELTHNFSSGYLTHNDSLILGSGNHHDGDICLDVLNLMNSVPLCLDTDFLSQVEEEPTFTFEDQDQVEHWQAFKRQSYHFYLTLVEHGNRFYFTHKVDKRGRIYSQGYHLNSQGASFKKAMLEFADQEIVEGVP